MAINSLKTKKTELSFRKAKIFNGMNNKKTLQEQINEKEWLTVEEAIEAINEAFRNLPDISNYTKRS